MDRFAHKYFSLTPYQCGASNPVKYIDVNGDSLAVFEDGKFLMMLNNGKPEITGFHQYTRKNAKGQTERYGGQSFEFNDPGDIPNLGEDNFELQVVKPEDIELHMKDADVDNPVNQENRWSYAKNESHTGKMDFWGRPGSRLNPNALYLIQGQAYNYQDAGNFLWGQSMKRLGFNYFTAAFGAEYDAWDSSKIANLLIRPYDRSDNPIVRWFQDKSWTGDSPGDQKAIGRGYFYNPNPDPTLPTPPFPIGVGGIQCKW